MKDWIIDIYHKLKIPLKDYSDTLSNKSFTQTEIFDIINKLYFDNRLDLSTLDYSKLNNNYINKYGVYEYDEIKYEFFEELEKLHKKHIEKIRLERIHDMSIKDRYYEMKYNGTGYDPNFHKTDGVNIIYNIDVIIRIINEDYFNKELNIKAEYEPNGVYDEHQYKFYMDGEIYSDEPDPFLMKLQNLYDLNKVKRKLENINS